MEYGHWMTTAVGRFPTLTYHRYWDSDSVLRKHIFSVCHDDITFSVQELCRENPVARRHHVGVS